MQLKIFISVNGVLKATRVINTPCVIGRSKNLGLTIAHPAVSRRHCELKDVDGTLRLFDLGSLNGTIYNGVMIDGEVILADEDEFSISDIHLKIQKQDPSPDDDEPIELMDVVGGPYNESSNTIAGTPNDDLDGLRLADD